MILVTHALTGAVIGKKIANPWLIIILSIFIHFILDSFRHGEYVEVFSKNTSIKNSGWKVILDLFTSFVLIFTIIVFQNFSKATIINIAFGIIFSLLPDFITFLFWKFRWKFLEKYYAFHSWLHKYPRHAPQREWTFQNITNDILISVAAIILLLI
jgi:ABC-type antimicrobial peptide transport system permease subunit